MHGTDLLEESIIFSSELEAIKKSKVFNFEWYPYGALNNFIHLEEFFNEFPLPELAPMKSQILDIGAADGDLAFFLERHGYKVQIVDNAPTNFNQLKGAKALKKLLKSRVGIHNLDLDALGITLPKSHYEVVFFLGILYHLKNPYAILEQLSSITKYMFLSTRITRNSANGISIFDQSLAYLVGPEECNNDETNYWMFTQSGLEKILSRTGWTIVKSKSVGDIEASNPFDVDHDERSFMLLKSMKNN
jgi:2-polyprenyl-3-methyl-5-hydroxy-6-metoxy-1,4-benzoquinol methylase